MINLQLTEWYEQILFYSFLLIGVIIIIYGIIKLISYIGTWLKNGGRIATGKFTVDADGKKTKKVPPHAVCPHAGDMMSVIARTTQYVEARSRIPSDLIDRQMKFYEETEVYIHGMMLRLLVKELDEFLPKGTEIVQHPEYLMYDSILSLIGYILKDYIKLAMRQNHFTDVSGDEWLKKKDRYATTIIERSTEMLNLYWRGDIVPRSVLYNINHEPEVVASLRSAVHALFDYARDEAKKSESELNAVRDEYERFLKSKITG